MKRIFFAVFSIVMLVSCNQSGQQNTPAKNDANQSENREVEKVRRPISFSGTFYQITNIGSPDIVFTEGDYSIEAEGPSSMVNAVNIDVDCNVLTVSMNNEERITEIAQMLSGSNITKEAIANAKQLLKL